MTIQNLKNPYELTKDINIFWNNIQNNSGISTYKISEENKMTFYKKISPNTTSDNSERNNSL